MRFSYVIGAWLGVPVGDYLLAEPNWGTLIGFACGVTFSWVVSKW